MSTKYQGSDEERSSLDLLIKLSRANDTVSVVLGSSLGGTGLTLSQFGVLDALYYLGDMSLGQLARKHLRSPNNMTSVIGTMERAGLVVRHRDTTDRRVVNVSLTDSGRMAYEQAWPRHLQAVTAAMAGLTADERDLTAGLLKKLGIAAGDRLGRSGYAPTDGQDQDEEG